MNDPYPESEWYIDNGVRYRRAVINPKDIKAKKLNNKKADKKEGSNEEVHETIHAEENRES